ncbi:MAG: antibiotic biosynthesis monooxygenase [Candidatus Levyibacteriota bacterium]
MHVRVGVYTLHGDLDQVVASVRDTALPMYKQQPGFVNYFLVKNDDGTLLSYSVWESRDAAEKASQIMSDFAKDTLPGVVELQEDFNGEVVVS